MDSRSWGWDEEEQQERCTACDFKGFSWVVRATEKVRARARVVRGVRSRDTLRHIRPLHVECGTFAYIGGPLFESSSQTDLGFCDTFALAAHSAKPPYDHPNSVRPDTCLNFTPSSSDACLEETGSWLCLGLVVVSVVLDRLISREPSLLSGVVRGYSLSLLLSPVTVLVSPSPFLCVEGEMAPLIHVRSECITRMCLPPACSSCGPRWTLYRATGMVIIMIIHLCCLCRRCSCSSYVSARQLMPQTRSLTCTTVKLIAEPRCLRPWFSLTCPS